MLESLSIRNYAIIDEMTVEFSPGLNVITGETGAGKSIVIDAFELVLGARASNDMIRAGADSMSVCGVFNITGEQLLGDIPFDTDNGLLFLRREIRSDGSGRCYVNDRPVTQRALKGLADLLVDLHGQHDHQSLLNVAEHVVFLDGYGRISQLADEVRALYGKMVNLTREIDSLEKRIKTFDRERELFLFQIEEIERANIRPGEDGDLERDIQRLSRARELKELGWEISSELSESENSIGDRLGAFITRIEQLSRFDGNLVQYARTVEELTIGINDLARAFHDYTEGIDDDPGVLKSMDERLAVVERIKKKYGPGLDDVFAYLEDIKKKVSMAETSDEHIADLKKKKDSVTARLTEQGHLLTEKRKEAAPRLVHEVRDHLSQLGMEGAVLRVAIDPHEGTDMVPAAGGMVPVGENGFDRVEFMISTNPGEPEKPLAKIASGGEISRIMLALKLALADTVGVPTMVFDEIDIGVSGRVADAVGRKIRELANNRQVIVITHLPQIAVMGTRHFSARKNMDGGRMVTKLKLLDKSERQEELALLLSGETMTDTARAHAKRLMDEVLDEEKGTGEKQLL